MLVIHDFVYDVVMYDVVMYDVVMYDVVVYCMMSLRRCWWSSTARCLSLWGAGAP